MSKLYPLKLRPSLREKIWGSPDLRPFVAGIQKKPVGEIWFSFEENIIDNGDLAGASLEDLMRRFGPRLMGSAYEPLDRTRRSAGQGAAAQDDAPYFPILSKLLFVNDKLSVQVHPDDGYALSHEGGPGKTEMWYVVDADPGAQVALGLTEPLSREQLIEQARSGEIEKRLNWVEVQAGDVIFVWPGLLHTLGPGVRICEIQQNSDLTYRFCDFGRLGDDGKPRELHIEQGAEVVSHSPWKGFVPHIGTPDRPLQRELLAACPYFAAERLTWGLALDYEPNPRRFELLIILEGAGRIGADEYQAGEAFLAPADAEPFRLEPAETSTALRAYVPVLDELEEELAAAGADRDSLANALFR